LNEELAEKVLHDFVKAVDPFWVEVCLRVVPGHGGIVICLRATKGHK
jgi:NADPH-dependent 7-cyano-7-deazaguanine reductase QueF